MESNKRHAVLVLALLSVVAALLFIPKYKTSRGSLKKADNPMMGQAPALPQEPVSRIEFMNEVFEEVKPPEWAGNILVKEPAANPADSLSKVLKWCQDAGIRSLEALVKSEMAEKEGGRENLSNAARTLIFAASESVDHPKEAAYLFQQGKRLIDLALAKGRDNAPVLNALIVYESEYINQPMKFLSTMKEALAVDSNNVETRLIRLNLLRKSAQWKKAAQECQKLISLQPQNPVWYFQASDIYGFMGDSTSARMYLDLAVKVQKNQKQ